MSDVCKWRINGSAYGHLMKLRDVVPYNDNDPVFTTKHIFYLTCGSSSFMSFVSFLHFLLLFHLHNMLLPACSHNLTLESTLCYRCNGRSYYDEWDSLSEWRNDWLFSVIEINKLSTNSTPLNVFPSHPLLICPHTCICFNYIITTLVAPPARQSISEE